MDWDLHRISGSWCLKKPAIKYLVLLSLVMYAPAELLSTHTYAPTLGMGTGSGIWQDKFPFIALDFLENNISVESIKL